MAFSHDMGLFCPAILADVRSQALIFVLSVPGAALLCPLSYDRVWGVTSDTTPGVVALTLVLEERLGGWL
jgi:hypothetical protein